MTSTVPFSSASTALANGLADFGVARRADPRAVPLPQGTRSEGAEKSPRFDHLVAEHAPADRSRVQTAIEREAPAPQRPAHAAGRRAPPAPARAGSHPAVEPETASAPRKEETTAAEAAETPVAPAATAGDTTKGEAEAIASADSAATDAAVTDSGTAQVTNATPVQTPDVIPAVTPHVAGAEGILSTDSVSDSALEAATGVPGEVTALPAGLDTAAGATALAGSAAASPASPATAAPAPTSVPTVGSAAVGGAALAQEAGLLAAAAIKAGEAGKALAAGSAEATDTAEALDAGEGGDVAALLAGNGEEGKAARPALADAVRPTSGPDAGKGGKDGAGEGVEGLGETAGLAKSASPNLHPTRAAHFAETLEGFLGSNAIHRPADILAGLDRPVAAMAMNRGSDIPRPTPLQMLPIEIGMQAVRGVTSFQIRLDPAELGRVDVKLHIQDNGEVKASLVVERAETLNLLRRDAATLQNAFEQAGLKQAPDGLSFSLRGEGQQGQQQEQRQPGGRSAAEISDDLALQAQMGDAVLRRVLIPNASIDRMV
jgi:flagellar hook-length control protein FliK